MPIANCFIKDKSVAHLPLKKMASEWAVQVGVEEHDICLTFIPNCVQAGQQYQVLANLYLPTLWPPQKVSDIQKSLLAVLCKHVNVSPVDVFIITSMVESGHVVEGGEIVNW